ncbi:MAG: DNA-processing protein DprA [Chloroflexota bacterium]
MEGLADQLADHGVGVLTYGTKGYPRRLANLPSPPPLIAYRGNLSLLASPGIGVCGARSASDAGLTAARRVGETAAVHGLVVIAGNAAGVDTTAQTAALNAGGSIVLVLPEGIARTALAHEADDLAADWDRVLVLSQFPFTQPWTVWGAMARNSLIAALGDALIVIEAGEQGGTRAAGEVALRLGQRVFVLQFEDGMPEGNRALIELGAKAVRNPSELMDAIQEAQSRRAADPDLQLALPL